MRPLAALTAALLVGCSAPADTDTDTDTDTDVGPAPAAALAGLWVGTQVDVLNRVDWKQNLDARGDCEEGDPAICDSVLSIDREGIPSGASAGELQFFETDRPGFFEGRGEIVGSNDGIWAIQLPDRQRLAVVWWQRSGGAASLSVHMKDKYPEDPLIPDRLYDATTLDGKTFTGSIFRFTGNGDLDPARDTTSVTIASEAAAAFTLAASSEIAAEPLRAPSPTLRYEADALDGWIGIYHAGTNLDPASTDLLAGEQTAYGTALAIPSREGTAMLLVTCEGSRSWCGDGAGGDLATWDLSRYTFALLGL